MMIISGVVITGQQRTRLLGFPTANISCCLPMREGVYAGLTSIPEISLSAIKTLSYYRDNILEAHLIGENLDLYGKLVSVQLTHFVRSPLPYQNDQIMIRQIEEDQTYILTYCYT